MKKTATVIRPYSQEARQYKLSDYPGVKLHWKCNETSGTTITDEVRSLQIKPTTSINFGNPAHSVAIEGATDDPVIGTYPTFDTTKFILSLMIARCTNSLEGRNPLGQIGGSTTSGPGISMSFNGGMHIIVDDDAATSLSVLADATKTLTSGTDYILAMMVRPTGSSIQGTAYNTDGTVAQKAGVNLTQSVTNTGLTTITPCAFNRTNGVAIYQWIVYQFTTEPTDLTSGMIWHAAMATSGIKAPYPAWKSKS